MKFKIDFDTKEVEELTKKYPEISKQVRKEKVHDALVYARDRMIPQSPYDSGRRSKSSLTYGHLRDQFNIAQYEPQTRTYGLIANQAWYGKVLERGRKPGIAKKTWHVYKGLPAMHWFEKGMDRLMGGIETILGEIPDEIINRAGGN